MYRPCGTHRSHRPDEALPQGIVWSVKNAFGYAIQGFAGFSEFANAHSAFNNHQSSFVRQETTEDVQGHPICRLFKTLDQVSAYGMVPSLVVPALFSFCGIGTAAIASAVAAAMASTSVATASILQVGMALWVAVLGNLC